VQIVGIIAGIFVDAFINALNLLSIQVHLSHQDTNKKTPAKAGVFLFAAEVLSCCR
jgi:hypothetical protein